MFTTLVFKEILSHLQSLRFAITFSLTLIIGFVGFVLSANDYERALGEYHARVQAYRHQLESILSDEEQWRIRWQLFHNHGKSDAVSIPPLSSVVFGLSEAVPGGVTMMANQWVNRDRNAWHNPMEGLHHRLDFTYMVSIIMSLLAILLIYDGISGEKEAGTLRLVLSQSVPRYLVLLSKWIAGMLLLMAPFIIVYIGGIGYLWSRGLLELHADHLQRLTFLLLLSMLYVSLFFNLALFISVCTHRATTALFSGLLIWSISVLAWPNLAPVIAKIITPAPSPIEIEAEKNAIDEEIRLKKDRVNLVSGGLSYGSSSKRAMEKLDEEAQRRKKELDDFLKKCNDQQSRWAGWLTRISPVGSFVFSATELAGTGPSSYERFEHSRERQQKAMNDKEKEVLKFFRESGWKKLPPLGEDNLPKVQWVIPGLKHVLERVVLNDVLVLTIFNAMFFLLSVAGFLRYDVR